MTDPITTPAQMREAAALAVANIEIGYHDGIGGDWHPYNGLHIISAACAAIRALPVADPLCTWPSCGHTAKGQCNPTFAPPVAERQKPQAVRVKPLVWVETFEDRGDGLSEHNGGYESASVLGFYEIGMGFGSDAYYWSVCDPNYNEIGSFEDPSYAKSAAQADYEARILAALDVSETPESDRQTELMLESERQAIRDQALEDAGEVVRLAEPFAIAYRIARQSLGPHADAGHVEAVALRYIRLQDLANLDQAIRAMKGKPE